MVLPSRCYERFSRLLPGIAGLDVSVQVKHFNSFVEWASCLFPSDF
ncbi:MAG: hypothetical protein F6K39_34530 [Okeania sp. SIO3B3]|nr:hypothetical protein [Okeania sp. SIO3B3]